MDGIKEEPGMKYREIQYLYRRDGRHKWKLYRETKRGYFHRCTVCDIRCLIPKLDKLMEATLKMRMPQLIQNVFSANPFFTFLTNHGTKN